MNDDETWEEEFIRHLKGERAASVNTLDAYTRSLRLFREELDARFQNWLAVTAEDIRYWLYLQLENQHSRSTVRLRLSALRSFFSFLVRRKYMEASPMNGVQMPKPEKKLPVFLNKSQMSELLELPMKAPLEKQAPHWLPFRDKAILELFYSCGLRLSELVSLNTHDIHLKEGFARILGKGSKQRIVPLGSYAVDAVTSYKEAAGVPAGGPLFLSRLGSRLSRRSVANLLEKYLRLSDIPHHITPHKIRHTFATHMLEAGADIRSVQELLGHASLATTQIYTHVTKKKLFSAYREAHPRARAEEQKEN